MLKILLNQFLLFWLYFNSFSFHSLIEKRTCHQRITIITIFSKVEGSEASNSPTSPSSIRYIETIDLHRMTVTNQFDKSQSVWCGCHECRKLSLIDSEFWLLFLEPNASDTYSLLARNISLHKSLAIPHIRTKGFCTWNTHLYCLFIS